MYLCMRWNYGVVDVHAVFCPICVHLLEPVSVPALLCASGVRVVLVVNMSYWGWIGGSAHCRTGSTLEAGSLILPAVATYPN